jgi:hypothetical protein
MANKNLQPLKPSKPKGLVSAATVAASTDDIPATRIRGAGTVMQDPKKTKLGRRL